MITPMRLGLKHAKKTPHVKRIDTDDPLWPVFVEWVLTRIEYCEHGITCRYDCCWHWKATILKRGWGLANWGKKFYALTGQTGMSAHRAVWLVLNNGVPPNTMHLDHSCHDKNCPGVKAKDESLCPHRSCVRIDHLAIMPPKDNSSQTFNRYEDRDFCPAGEHAVSKANTGRTPSGSPYCVDCRLHKAALRKEARDERARAKAGTRAARGKA
jgi:hypothetical protein